MAKPQYNGFGDVVPFHRGLASYSPKCVEVEFCEVHIQHFIVPVEYYLIGLELIHSLESLCSTTRCSVD